MQASTSLSAENIVRNAIIGFTVSFVALSLGAALGILSGRGAFSGMFSAGIIAFFTALLGGTRVQCSGPTAPMSAVSALVVAYAASHLDATASTDQFINLVFLLNGLVLLLMALLRLGRFIAYVPNVVVSGFMSGIALLIWQDQLNMLTGSGNKAPLHGGWLANSAVALTTLVLIFVLAPLMRRLVGHRARFLPSTLLAILFVSLGCGLLNLPIEHVQLSGNLQSLSDLTQRLAQQWPRDWSFGTLSQALPFSLQLALLCYLDTLLTSLVVDKMSGETTHQNQELMAQGVANSACALIGGIPGAQATIRSVLMLKENANLRLAGILTGVFVLVEMLLFQEWINAIPKAVFVGVLLKVGYDVFDFMPLRLYLKQLASKRGRQWRDFFSRHDDLQIFVTNREALMISGTAVATLVLDLNMAVAGFTLLFYLHNKAFNRHNPMRDLAPEKETAAFYTQD
ncbi:MAG: SulP family inorganic anion transporter [Desulfuromonadaceae bacterium]|nr:SulP family inorganic anion transporter [Desulfuromonadaceae bacterium]